MNKKVITVVGQGKFPGTFKVKYQDGTLGYLKNSSKQTYPLEEGLTYDVVLWQQEGKQTIYITWAKQHDWGSTQDKPIEGEKLPRPDNLKRGLSPMPSPEVFKKQFEKVMPKTETKTVPDPRIQIEKEKQDGQSRGNYRTIAANFITATYPELKDIKEFNRLLKEMEDDYFSERKEAEKQTPELPNPSEMGYEG